MSHFYEFYMNAQKNFTKKKKAAQKVIKRSHVRYTCDEESEFLTYMEEKLP